MPEQEKNIRPDETEENGICSFDFIIRDTGIGMSEETIQNLMSGKPAEKDDKKSSTGIGMDNVMARLKLFVGSDDVMSIESEGEGKGPEVGHTLDQGRNSFLSLGDLSSSLLPSLQISSFPPEAFYLVCLFL